MLIIFYALCLFTGSISAQSALWLGGGDCPWGNRGAGNAHPQHDMPDTGVTRHYDFHVSRATMAPDGVPQNMIVVNNQYPGPVLEANWGDWIEVNVFNDIYGPEEGTTMHWHGLNQPGTPWFDGVPTVDQCPIVPGSNLTYRFRADEYGSSWYHSHLPGQYSAGALGPIIIHGPSSEQYDVDLGVVTVGEWYHQYYTKSLADLLAPNPVPGPPALPLARSNLVNGKGRYSCASVTDGSACAANAPYSSWNVEPGKTYKLRLVNTGASAFETISLDNHTFTVIANDFVPVQPYQTSFVTLGVAQRTDVLFTATGDKGQSYWLRAWNAPDCADTLAPNDIAGADGRGIIAYSGSDVTIEPTSIGLPVPANPLCSNSELTTTVPAYAIPVVSQPDITFTFHIDAHPNENGALRIYINNVTYVGDNSAPVLLSPNLTALHPETLLPPGRQVYNSGNAKTVRIILYNGFVASHPFHLHGHDFQVLSSGKGIWDGQIVSPSNPQRRDTQMLWGGANATDPNVGVTHLVLQYEADNPGLFNLHCHNSWHLASGMNVLMLERPEELKQLLSTQLPSSIADTCTQWNTWVSHGSGGGPTGGS